DAAVDAGRIGLIIVITGMIGAVAFGIVLDVFNKFKETIISVYTLGLLSMIVFTFTLESGIVALYLVSALLG
ncbi:hypothetical protein ILUMI_15463, partial [Ignelater luminosus]